MPATELTDGELYLLARLARTVGSYRLAHKLEANTFYERGLTPIRSPEAPMKHTAAGGRDQTAVIGHAPEHRDWQPGDPVIPPDIDATARLEAFVTVDAGMLTATHIGARAWLMKHVHVGHDAWVGDDVEIAPHSSIGGHAVIGDGVKMGQGVLVRPHVTIGAGARLGMGAVVVRDVPAGQVWVGNPAARIRWRNEDYAPTSYRGLSVVPLEDGPDAAA